MRVLMIGLALYAAFSRDSAPPDAPVCKLAPGFCAPYEAPFTAARAAARLRNSQWAQMAIPARTKTDGAQREPLLRASIVCLNIAYFARLIAETRYPSISFGSQVQLVAPLHQLSQSTLMTASTPRSMPPARSLARKRGRIVSSMIF